MSSNKNEFEDCQQFFLPGFYFLIFENENFAKKKKKESYIMYNVYYNFAVVRLYK